MGARDVQDADGEVIACDTGDRHEMGARDVKDPEPQEKAQERVRSCGLQRKRATSWSVSIGTPSLLRGYGERGFKSAL